MKRDLMAVLACPKCKEGLDLEVAEEDPDTADVLEGTLVCDNCKHVYPIVDGIPDLRPVDDG